MHSDIFIGKFDIFKHTRSQNVLTFDLRLCFYSDLKKLIWQKMELIVNIFVPSFFTTYDVYFHKNVLMNLHFCMAKKYHAMAL